MTANPKLVTVEDYKVAARQTLPRMLYDFVEGGALSNQTRNRNSDGFADLWLRGGAFRSTPQVDTSVEVLGSKIRIPVIVAPTGGSGLLWPRGEQEVARACAAFGTVMSVSAGSIATLEDIAAAGSGPKWLQLFVYKDRGLTQELIARARAAGYTAICVTTDAPVHGLRIKDIKNGFTVDRRITLSSLADALMHVRWWLRMWGAPRPRFSNFDSRAAGNISDMAAYMSSVLDPSVTWDDFSWLRSQWDGPLIVKGICHPDDAREAVVRGASAIQVSTHGGRQLDGSIAAIDALPGVVDAVQARVPVLLDGGVSRGSDIAKAVALGATACLIGRTHLWGLAVAGGAGVASVLRILETELSNLMCIGGWKSIAELDRSSLARTGAAIQDLRPAQRPAIPAAARAASL